MRIGKLLLMGLSIYSSLEANTQIKIENQSNIFDVDILKQHTKVDGINNLLLANAGMCVVSPEEINKYYLQKTMKTEINNKEKLEKDIVRLSSKKADVPKEDIKSIFIKRTSDMYVREIRNQVLQILNYNDNKTSGDKQLVSLLANCNGAMKKYNPDKNEQSRIAFNKSLDNTVNALEEERGYEKYLNNLKINNKKSFIVAPITSKSHLFSMVIRKIKNKKGEIYLDVVVVNKGGRREEIGENNITHHIYEKYMIPQKNIKEFSKMLGYRKNMDKNGNIITTGKVYEKIRGYTEKSTYQSMKGLTARQQVMGNCYYKELEAGLKYAYASSYNVYEKKIINGKELKIPKWPEETIKFHKEIIDSVKDAVDAIPIKLREKVELKEYINKNFSIYAKNKNYRKELENRILENEDDRKIFVKYFGNGAKDIDKIKDEQTLKEMFKDVDFITFNENYLLFMQMLEDAGVKVPKYLLDIHGGLSAVTQIVDYMYNNKKEDGDFIKEYFTWTYDIIMMKYKSKLENSPKKDKIKPELINTPKKNFQKDMEK